MVPDVYMDLAEILPYAVAATARGWPMVERKRIMWKLGILPNPS